MVDTRRAPEGWVDLGVPGPDLPRAVADVVDRVPEAVGQLPAALDVARQAGGAVPGPGRGRTALLWSLLASVAAVDLTTARVVEPHLDALAILEQAGTAPLAADGTVWGVYAAHAPGVRLDATPDGAGGWRLSGTKPWCSLATVLDAAVVTAHTSPTARRAFAVDLRHPGVSHDGTAGWVSRGLPLVTSVATHYDAVPAAAVGGDDWYLERPGFAWGGMAVAACWYGGAVGLARTLARAATRREPDQVGLAHLGAVDARLHAAREVLVAAARAVDAGAATGSAGALAAARVRAVIASAAEEVLTRLGHALGPGPLTADAAHAARVADLQVYLRQHHAERDEAALGRLLLGEGVSGG